jgi:hypothetical protein
MGLNSAFKGLRKILPSNISANRTAMRTDIAPIKEKKLCAKIVYNFSTSKEYKTVP